MRFRTLRWALSFAVVAVLIGCSQKADTTREKAATDVKDKVVADAIGCRGPREGERSARRWRRRLHLRLSTRHHGDDEARTDRMLWHQKAVRRRWGVAQTAAIAVDDHLVTAPNADTLYTLAWLDVSRRSRGS